MKKYFKYLFITILFITIFPIITNAASYTLEKKEINNNVAIYDIVYDPLEEPAKEINLDLTKTNNDLNYVVEKNENGGIAGSCDSFPCHISLDLVTTKTVLATLTIKNTTNEAQTTIIALSGDASSEPQTIALKAMETTTSTTTTTTQKIYSKDTTLSNIQISVGVMDQTFNKDITITPDCDNNCWWVVTCPLGECSVSNSRKVSLQTGANKVSINVTSEDGQNSKAYILNVYRGEIETSSAYLSDIKIKDAELSPSFDTMTNDYTTTIGMDVNKLEIDTIAEDPEAKIEIKGNDNLVEGENTITITVTSSDNENKQVYSIIVTKEEKEEETIEENEENTEEKKDVNVSKVEKKKNNLWLIIVLGLLAVGAITTTAILLFRKKKNKKNNKNDKNNKGGGSKVEDIPLIKENKIEQENTESLNILNETRRQMNEEPKQSIDEALDDLMQTKRLELGDLGL